RDAAALRRVALGAYLPSLSLISSAAWSDQTTLGTAGVTPGLSPAGGMNTYGAGFAAALDVFTGGRRGAQRNYAEAITQAADAGPLHALEPAPLALGDSGVLAAAPAAAPAVAQAQALASAGAAGVRASKSQYLPTIAVGAGYNWANESRVPGALRSGWVVAF